MAAIVASWGDYGKTYALIQSARDAAIAPFAVLTFRDK